MRPIFDVALIELHHIGSTAVPELSAKPEIDILAIVRATRLIDQWAEALAARGYRRGGDLSAGHHFFKRDAGMVRTHKLHVCIDGHPMASQMLRFRNHLRTTPADRNRYEALKLRLEAENKLGIGEYLAGKAPFIRSVLDRAG